MIGIKVRMIYSLQLINTPVCKAGRNIRKPCHFTHCPTLDSCFLYEINNNLVTSTLFPPPGEHDVRNCSRSANSHTHNLQIRRSLLSSMEQNHANKQTEFQPCQRVCNKRTEDLLKRIRERLEKKIKLLYDINRR